MAVAKVSQACVAVAKVSQACVAVAKVSHRHEWLWQRYHTGMCGCSKGITQA